MRFDHNLHDGILIVSGDQRRSVWSSQLVLKGSRTLRTAGQMTTTASRHTLQLLALTSALRSITRTQAAFLAPRNQTNPRLLVTSIDSTFLNALRAKMPLRAGRNFFTLAAQQLARFDLTFATPEDGDKTVLMLSNWAANHVYAPGSIPSVLLPVAVSQVI